MEYFALMVNGFWDKKDILVTKMDVTLESLGIIYLVRTQNVPKKQHFLPSDTHTYVFVSGVRNVLFENFC